jgi:hypothetical protein
MLVPKQVRVISARCLAEQGATTNQQTKRETFHF